MPKIDKIAKIRLKNLDYNSNIYNLPTILILINGLIFLINLTETGKIKIILNSQRN